MPGICGRFKTPGPALLAAILVLTLSPPASADIVPLTFYQIAARADMIVRARALSSSTRRPRVQVLEVIKGACPGKELRIVPHFEDNASPTTWLDREVFVEGQESILFLVPYVDRFGRDEGADSFAVLGAAAGKMDVPPEGGDALLEAVRTFVSVSTEPQHERQAAEMRRMLSSANPFILEAALQECRRFRLARPEDLAVLTGLLVHPRPDFRAGALSVLEQVVADMKSGFLETPSPSSSRRKELFDKAVEAARFDGAEEVRERAVGLLEAFGDAAALALLESIGRSDESQAVRYRAQVAAVHLRENLR